MSRIYFEQHHIWQDEISSVLDEYTKNAFIIIIRENDIIFRFKNGWVFAEQFERLYPIIHKYNLNYFFGSYPTVADKEFAEPCFVIFK